MANVRARIGTDPETGLTVILCSATELSTGRPCDRPRNHAGAHVSTIDGSTLAWALTRGTADTVGGALDTDAEPR